MPTSSGDTRLSVDRLVAAARQLLVKGGPAAVVVREVARVLSVAPSAMYKHVAGREQLLWLLSESCYGELADLCTAARDAEPPGHHRARLGGATEAFRAWSIANAAEFTLLFGSPAQLQTFHAATAEPPGSVRFGSCFLTIFRDALADGRLLTRDESGMDPSMIDQLSVAGAPWHLRAGELYPAVLGLQRMVGIVAVEMTGQLAWALPDPTVYTREQFESLIDVLLTPGP